MHRVVPFRVAYLNNRWLTRLFQTDNGTEALAFFVVFAMLAALVGASIYRFPFHTIETVLLFMVWFGLIYCYDLYVSMRVHAIQWHTNQSTVVVRVVALPAIPKARSKKSSNRLHARCGSIVIIQLHLFFISRTLSLSLSRSLALSHTDLKVPYSFSSFTPVDWHVSLRM
jgi:hypothetical protein